MTTMRKNITILCIISLNLFMSGFLQAQDLSEKLGGVKTDFIFTSHGKELEVTRQVISKRAERFYDWGGHKDGAYGYGYGYESFHLEFTVKNGEIDLPESGSLFKNEKPLFLDFYDEDDNLLGSKRISPREIRFVSNNSTDPKLIHYTIDLITIPLPLLDSTKRIDLFRE